MAGISGIISTIQQQTQEQCAQIIAKAEKDVIDTRSKARKQGEQAKNEILKQGELDFEMHINRAKSAVDVGTSRAILQKKVELVNEVIDKALENMQQLNDSNYEKAMLELVARFALPEAGTIQISENDKNKLSDDFNKKLQKQLPEKASLKVQMVPKDLGGGCILVYGQINQNCTFEALINLMRDEITDKVSSILFGNN